MTPWDGTANANVSAVVVATADAAYRTMDFAKIFPGLKVLLDGRNACAGATLPADAMRIGFGRPNGVAAQ
jgi:UDP-N-acetyl-D-mannosaminuronate dehydrogenase